MKYAIERPINYTYIMTIGRYSIKAKASLIANPIYACGSLPVQWFTGYI